MSAAYEENIKRLTGLAEANGLKLNDDAERVNKVAGLMTSNYDLVGEWVCPCKQTVKPAEKGKDITCPCPEWLDEIKENGHCHCRLFYS